MSAKLQYYIKPTEISVEAWEGLLLIYGKNTDLEFLNIFKKLGPFMYNTLHCVLQCSTLKPE